MASDDSGNNSTRKRGDESNKGPVYDREEVNMSITALYQVLQRMYLPPNSIKYPPLEG